MVKNLKARTFIILIVLGASIFYFYPPKDKIKLGLDLKGGMHLVLGVKTDKVIATELAQAADRAKRLFKEKKVPAKSFRSEGTELIIKGVPEGGFSAAEGILKDYFARSYKISSHFENGEVSFELKMIPSVKREIEKMTVQQSKDTLERRINAYGVAEPTIQIYGSLESGVAKQIIVELPGVDNPEEVKSLLKETASLELKLVHPTAPFAASRKEILKYFGGKLPDGYELVQYTGDYGEGQAPPEGEKYIVVKSAPVITGRHMTNARPSQDMTLGLAKPAVSFTLNSEGARRFGQATEANIGRQLAIILDNKAISAPRIQSKITDSGIITGLRSKREADILALSLRSGALPADIVILEERTIGPSLGLESIQHGVNAAILGLVLVILSILVYYKISGFNAVFCLLINLLILLGALGYFRGTLTLPGIAGIILTIGMAVDSNVLIFERIKEELRLGKTIRSSVEAGFSKASLTIMDANVTTLIAAAFLYQFGTGPIKGFAVTLTAGLLANLFAAIFVSKTIFQVVLDRFQIKKLSI